MARRNIFYPFRPAQTGGPKQEEEQTIPRPLTAKKPPSRSCRGIYNASSTGKFPDRTDQQLSSDEITSSVRSINDLAQHSYSHVIRIYRLSSVQRELEDKITLWCQQEKSFNE
jgi:hypothetical protein